MPGWPQRINPGGNFHMTTRRRAASLLAISLCTFAVPAYAVSCLLFPLSCLKPKKKYGDEMEAVVLDLRSQRTDAYEVRVPSGGGVYMGPTVVADPLQNKRAWYIWFKVGETLYQAERDETVLQMAYKKPKREDWVGQTVKLRFKDQKWMGLKSSWVVFDRGKGKDWDFVLISIVGPDGIDECSKWKLCPYQADVDREAREQEQLAQLGKTGARSASDVAPMPVNLPELPDADAPGAAPADAAPPEVAAPAPEAGETAPATGPATEPQPAEPAADSPPGSA
jgi:hypothetical protein